jgi:hypothetical protein
VILHGFPSRGKVHALRRQGDPYSYCGQIFNFKNAGFDPNPAIPDGYGDNRCQDCLRLVREDGK